jgi:hypothetical protein
LCLAHIDQKLFEEPSAHWCAILTFGRPSLDHKCTNLFKFSAPISDWEVSARPVDESRPRRNIAYEFKAGKYLSRIEHDVERGLYSGRGIANNAAKAFALMSFCRNPVKLCKSFVCKPISEMIVENSETNIRIQETV